MAAFSNTQSADATLNGNVRSVMRGFKRLARIGLHASGGLHAARWYYRKNFRILMYHGFSAVSAAAVQNGLAEQCSYMRRFFNPVSLDRIAEHLRDRKPLPPNSIAVTVDDGYRDFLTAFPVFRAAQIPVTVFLVTGFLDRRLWLWPDMISYAAAHTRLRSVRVPLDPSAEPLDFRLVTGEDRQSAAYGMYEAVLTLDNSRRLAFLRQLPDLFEVEVPAGAPSEYAPLSWDEVRSLADGGIDFGSHTITHPVLSRIATAEELECEIAGSRARLEAELRRPVVHFCYPNGKAADFDARVMGTVERCGYQTAVTAIPERNASGISRYALRRIGVEPENPQPYFRECVSGLHQKAPAPLT